MSNSNTAAVEALPVGSIGEKHPCLYVGKEPLSGIEPNSDGFVPGVYWEEGQGEGTLFLFQPDGSTKIFEVSDEDIRRTVAATV